MYSLDKIYSMIVGMDIPNINRNTTGKAYIKNDASVNKNIISERG